MKLSQVTLRSYVTSLGDPALRLTALRVALTVGTLLFAINHGSALFKGEMTRGRWLSAGLTYLVPYAVNIHGQVASRIRSQR